MTYFPYVLGFSLRTRPPKDNSLLNASSLLCTLLLCTLASTVSWAESASSDAADAAPKSVQPCISLRKLDHIEILDNQRLVFHLQGKSLYLNELPRRCSGLHKNATIVYKTSLPQLCDLDNISVLRSTDTRFNEGPLCPLGPFTAIDEQQLKALKRSGS